MSPLVESENQEVLSGHRTTNGWNEWSKFVLKELERLAKEQERMNDEIKKHLAEWDKSQDAKFDDVSDKITKLQLSVSRSSAIAGFIAGAIPVVLTLVLFFLSK